MNGKYDEVTIEDLPARVVVQISDKMAALVEQRVKFILAPKPKYLPMKVWFFLVKLIVNQEYYPMEVKQTVEGDLNK